MKDRQSRRDFMGLTAAGVAGLLTPPWLAEARGVPRSAGSVNSLSADPDLIVYNAKVYTIDPAAPRAEAFAVLGGRFVQVGRTTEINALAGKRTQSIDAKQMTIVPGSTGVVVAVGEPRHDRHLLRIDTLRALSR